MDLIILPFHDWRKCESEGLRSRDGHFLAHYLNSPRVNRILLIDRPISLPERLIKHRPLRICTGHHVARRGRAMLSQVGEKLFVLDTAAPDLISPLWLRRDWWDAIFRRQWVMQAIRWGIREAELSAEKRALVCSSPLATAPLGQLGEQASMFDAIDNWTRHPGMADPRGWIRRGYETACRDADVLICNSENTARFLESLGGQPRVIRNGVDPDRWDPKLYRDRPPPADLDSIPRPWIGYAGRLGKRIHVELLAELARRRPAWSFVMLGPFLDRSWFRSLRGKSNIHFLGDKHYEEVVGYVAHFDAATIPHNVGAYENDGDPTKLYEYLALGLPVATTPIAGVHDFDDLILISDNPDQWESGIETMLRRRRENPDACLSNRDAILKPEYDWKSKAELMLDLLEEAMAHKS